MGEAGTRCVLQLCRLGRILAKLESDLPCLTTCLRDLDQPAIQIAPHANNCSTGISRFDPLTTVWSSPCVPRRFGSELELQPA